MCLPRNDAAQPNVDNVLVVPVVPVGEGNQPGGVDRLDDHLEGRLDR